MAKLNLEKQKFMLLGKIKTSESLISKQNEKIKNWQNEIKAIETEERRIFAEEFLSIIDENGLIEKNDKNEILSKISKIAKQAALLKSENISSMSKIKNDNNENMSESEDNKKSESNKNLTETEENKKTESKESLTESEENKKTEI